MPSKTNGYRITIRQVAIGLSRSLKNSLNRLKLGYNSNIGRYVYRFRKKTENKRSNVTKPYVQININAFEFR